MNLTTSLYNLSEIMLERMCEYNCPLDKKLEFKNQILEIIEELLNQHEKSVEAHSQALDE